MLRFSQLYTQLDRTTKTTGKLAALRDYFTQAPAEDAAWALYFLCGHRPRQPIPARRLAGWLCEQIGLQEWLFEECYGAVGDLAETLALLLPDRPSQNEHPLHYWVEHRLLPLRQLDEASQRVIVEQAWRELDRDTRFVFNKLLTGGFRVGVSQQLVVRALAEVAGLPPATIAQRLMGEWSPSPELIPRLMAPEETAEITTRPYPFCLAHPLEEAGVSPVIPEELGPLSEWLAEWKWDGIRAQIVRRGGETCIWSRGEELIAERFPELLPECHSLPEGTVLDGEILAMRDGRVMPFVQLQRRIGRKSVGKKLLADVPAVFMAFDLLEWDGQDLRSQPTRDRRALLEQIFLEPSPFSQNNNPAAIIATKDPRLQLSPRIEATDWAGLAAIRQESRERGVEGCMLKRWDAPYLVGRARGLWWKWKIEPMTVDAVLIYAQRGHGKRASLYTDYTFGVWDAGQLVPFAKAYSGLTDAEIAEVDRFIRKNTREAFGPVRSVTPELVFELAFESLQPSTRHKSGIAVRFPRMLRWRKDKTAAQADSLDSIRALLS